jgi:hypothetical protein
MNEHANVKVATSLPGHERITFTTTGDYRLRTATGWLECWCQPDIAGDSAGTWVAVYPTEADARSGATPLIRMSRLWFAEIAMCRVGEHEGVLS